MPEQDQWSGPRRFTAHRAKKVVDDAEVVGEVKEVAVEERMVVEVQLLQGFHPKIVWWKILFGRNLVKLIW